MHLRFAKVCFLFALVDVCFVLRLRIVGEEVKLENDEGGLVNKLFDDGKEIKLETILKKFGDKN